MTNINAPMETLALAFGLVMARVGAFVTACPSFAPAGVVGLMRGVLVVALSLAMFVALPPWRMPQHVVSGYIAELACGLLLGLVVRLASAAAQWGGELLDMGAGFGFTHMLDPTTQEMSTPLQQIAQLVVGTLFFVSGAQRYVLQTMAHSFTVAPPGQALWHTENVMVLSHQVADLFGTGLRLAAPLLAVLLSVQLLLALMVRVAPQLNLWSVGFAFTCTALLIGLWLFAPAWVDESVSLWHSAVDTMAQVQVR